MRTVIFAVVVVILGCLYSEQQTVVCDVLPSYAAGSEISQIHSVARLQVGTLKKKLKLAIDRSSSELKLSVPLNKELSRSFIEFNGGSDIVYIGEEEVLFKITFDLEAASDVGCFDCQGVLGLGAGSPVWLHYSKAIYTPGAIYFDEGLPSYSYAARGNTDVECDLFTSQLCVTTGSVLGIPVNVAFGMDSVAPTLLPGDIFDAYVGNKSLSSDVSEWSDLVINFPDLANSKPLLSASASKLVIRRKHIMSPSSSSGYHLNIDLSPPGDPTVYLGRTATLDYMLEIHRSTRKAKIVDYSAEKSYSTVVLLVGILLALIFHRWKTVPNGSWESIGYRAPEKMFLFGISIFSAILIYGTEEYQGILKPFVEVDVYVGIVIVGMTLWSFLVFLAYFEWIRNIFGLVRYKIPGRKRSSSSSVLPKRGGGDSRRIEPIHERAAAWWIDTDWRSVGEKWLYPWKWSSVFFDAAGDSKSSGSDRGNDDDDNDSSSDVDPLGDELWSDVLVEEGKLSVRKKQNNKSGKKTNDTGQTPESLLSSTSHTVGERSKQKINATTNQGRTYGNRAPRGKATARKKATRTATSTSTSTSTKFSSLSPPYSSSPFAYPQSSAPSPDTLLIPTTPSADEIRAIGASIGGSTAEDITFSGNHKKKKRKKGKWLTKGNSVYFNPRLWAISTVSVETIVITAIWVLLLQNRSESLWGYISMGVFLYLLFDYIQHFVIILNLGGGTGKLSFFWWFFVLFVLGVILSSFYIGQRYVIGPTLNQLTQVTSVIRIFIAVFIYLGIIYIAIWAAMNTLQLYKRRIDEIIAKIENERNRGETKAIN